MNRKYNISEEGIIFKVKKDGSGEEIAKIEAVAGRIARMGISKDGLVYEALSDGSILEIAKIDDLGRVEQLNEFTKVKRLREGVDSGSGSGGTGDDVGGEIPLMDGVNGGQNRKYGISRKGIIFEMKENGTMVKIAKVEAAAKRLARMKMSDDGTVYEVSDDGTIPIRKIVKIDKLGRIRRLDKVTKVERLRSLASLDSEDAGASRNMGGNMSTTASRESMRNESTSRMGSGNTTVFGNSFTRENNDTRDARQKYNILSDGTIFKVEEDGTIKKIARIDEAERVWKIFDGVVEADRQGNDVYSENRGGGTDRRGYGAYSENRGGDGQRGTEERGMDSVDKWFMWILITLAAVIALVILLICIGA